MPKPAASQTANHRALEAVPSPCATPRLFQRAWSQWALVLCGLAAVAGMACSSSAPSGSGAKSKAPSSASKPAASEGRVGESTDARLGRQGEAAGQPARPAGAAGMRVYLDEEGHAAVPPEGAAAVAPLPRANLRDRAVFYKSPVPGGGDVVDVGPQPWVYSVATRGHDGQVRVDCVRAPNGAQGKPPASGPRSPQGQESKRP